MVTTWSQDDGHEGGVGASRAPPTQLSPGAAPADISALGEGQGEEEKEGKEKAEEKSIVRVPVNFCSRRMPGLGREALGGC